jgi:hypothetical protein
MVTDNVNPVAERVNGGFINLTKKCQIVVEASIPPSCFKSGPKTMHKNRSIDAANVVNGECKLFFGYWNGYPILIFGIAGHCIIFFKFALP